MGGCTEAYLDEPFYHHNCETTYPIRYKDNLFVGVPTMTGDLIGCVAVFPFSPAYLVMIDNYKNDEDATQSVKASFGFIPRVCGYVVGTPFRFAKWVVYDYWVYP